MEGIQTTWSKKGKEKKFGTRTDVAGVKKDFATRPHITNGLKGWDFASGKTTRGGACETESGKKRCFSIERR